MSRLVIDTLSRKKLDVIWSWSVYLGWPLKRILHIAGVWKWNGTSDFRPGKMYELYLIDIVYDIAEST
jgi:hypothetical protein